MALAADPPALGDERFSLLVAARADGVHVAVSGPLDLSSAPDLRQLGEALHGTTGPVTLDLGGLTFVDSTGITALVAFKGELDLQLRALTVEHVQPQTMDLLRMLGVDEALGLTAG